MTAPTSDERREVASTLRQMANAHDATEASRVAHALGIEYKVYGTVVAFDSADIRNLADLIDPTCTAPLGEHEHGWLTRECSECSYTIKTGNKYCPNCGARVVSDDE